MKRRRNFRRSKNYLEKIRRRRRIGEDISDHSDVRNRKVRTTKRADDDDRSWRRSIRDEDDAESDSLPATNVEDQAEEPRRFPQVDRAGTDPKRSPERKTTKPGDGGRRADESNYLNRNRGRVRSYRERKRSRRNRRNERRKLATRGKEKIKEKRYDDYFFDEESLEALANKAFKDINEAMEDKAEIDKFRDLIVKEAHALPSKNLSLKAKLVTENESKNVELYIEGLMKVIDDEGIFECYIGDKKEELFDKDSTIKVEIRENKIKVLDFDYRTYVESMNEKTHLLEGNVSLEDE